uniref:Uncharacterized protein n=1 Tax=Panagrolaimus sp. ES5 TaxID=591445 RepID=A0AC34GVB5_9BILA
MVDDSRPFPHLSNILHQLGHELHTELTEDICRRNAARRFENKLEIPINRAKLEKASIGAATFPYYSKLAPQCGDCALITMKKPIERLRGPPPHLEQRRRRSSSKIQIVKRTKSMTSVTNRRQNNYNNGDGQHQQRRQQQQQRHQKPKVPKMCNSSTQTDPILDGAKMNEERIDSKIAEIGGEQIDESFTVTETSNDTMCGKYEQRMDGKRHWKHRKFGNNQQLKKEEKEKSVKIVPAKEVAPKEVVKKEEKPKKRRTRKCSTQIATEEAIPRIPRDQQLYAPIELHCATESAVKAVDRTVNALEKLVLLAPKNSIEKHLMKTISLMCVFLRQFHTELRTRKDRRSKLEIILKLWTELQNQSSQGHQIHIPSEVYQQQSATNTVEQTAPPPTMSTDDVTVKMDSVSPISPSISISSFSNCFEMKNKKSKF